MLHAYLQLLRDSIIPQACLFLKIQIQKYLVFIVLLYADVTFRDLERGMVVDHHNDNRMHARFPRMIPEGFPQGMAANLIFKI